MGADAGSTAPAAAHRFSVDVRREGSGWSAVIVDPEGRAASARACRDETEARIYASTVRQHSVWLSEERFRDYYGLQQAG